MDLLYDSAQNVKVAPSCWGYPPPAYGVGGQNHKAIDLIVLVLLIGVNAPGQSKITAFHYDISLPDWRTKDFVDEIRWLGVGFDGRWFLNSDMPATLGISLGWHVFDEKTNETIVFDNGAAYQGW